MIQKNKKQVRIKDANLQDAVTERYISYALATITQRALPDVRDGLKPVHRRLLFAMKQLNLDSKMGFKKSARIIGDVIGKFHPHGDQSVYDTLVRLSQSFVIRYPLIYGQGNFGNIDGDNPAAMRYTEAKLTEIAELMLDGIYEETVDFRPTYDEQEFEPIVLPSAFPNLLANGSTGIAVGMSTSIPPHNIVELCNSFIFLVNNPTASISTIVKKYLPGPDFPTGGEIVESQSSILSSYKTGRGSFRLRGKWKKEDLSKGQYIINVYEIPYMVQKSKLIEKIAGLINEKKINSLIGVSDESSEDVRIVLIPRNRNVNAELLMENLFKLTDLETRIQFNLNVLNSANVPEVLSIKGALKEFIDHRFQVLKRRSKFRLRKIENRLEILKGFLTVYKNLNRVIKIIRQNDDPGRILKKSFRLTEVQTNAILDMKLRSLRRLEEKQIVKEDKNLKEEKRHLVALLKNRIKQKKKIIDEFEILKRKYVDNSSLSNSRLTAINNKNLSEDISDEIAESDIISKSVTILCSTKGWVRTVKGHLEKKDFEKINFKQGDKPKFMINANTTDKIIIFTTLGRFYTLACNKFPSGQGFGKPLKVLLNFSDKEDIVEIFVHTPSEKLIVVSSDSRGFVVNEDEILASTKTGRQVLNVKQSVKAVCCTKATGDYLGVIGGKDKFEKMLVFMLKELPTMSKGRGVILQKISNGRLRDVITFSKEEGIFDYYKKRELISFNKLKKYFGKRSQAGKAAPKELKGKLPRAFMGNFKK